MTTPQNYKLTKIALAVSAALLLAGCGGAPTKPMTMTSQASVAITPMPGYFPVEIQNNVGTGSASYPVTNVYMLFSAQESAAPNQQCLMSLTQNTSITTYNAWTANCIPLTMKSKAAQYAYSMSSLQPIAGAPVVIYVPPVISGRAFVSLNYPLDIPMTRAADGSVSIQAPSLGNSTDGNYNLIYDKFEYTYTPNSTGQPTFWIDTTSVDDFSLPIALSYGSQLNGYTNQDRDTVMQGIQSILGTGSPSWQKLQVVDSVSNTGTVIRVDAPNTSPNFNPDYLTPVDSGFDYRGTVVNYYAAGNTLSIDCKEVFPAGTPANVYTFTGTITNGQFVFQNSPTTGSPTVVSIDLAHAPSSQFFGPGQAPLDTPNKTVRSVIVKNLTALFSVGLLPAPTGTALSPSYFTTQMTNKTYYKQNSILANPPYQGYQYSKGPWYDLYAQAIHQTAANPVYAFAFDDVLKQDGTLSVINANNDQSQPVMITLGSVDQLEVPQPGKNYTANPPANDIAPVSDVKNPAFSCTSTSCTLQATWTLPTAQDPAVEYFVLPTPSPIETSIVLKNQALRPFFATGSTITFPIKNLKPIPTSVNAVTVYACIPHPKDTKAIGFDCPSEANGYALAPMVVGATSSAKQLPLLGVKDISNPGFTCTAGSCSLTATWKVQSKQPAYAVYYIVPQNNTQASIVDIMNGQTLKGGTSTTLTLPQSKVTTTAAGITVYTCGNNATQFCPNAGNGYNQSQSPGVSAPAP